MSSEIFSINFIRSEFVPYRVRRIAVYVILAYLAANLAFTALLVGSGIFSSIEGRWLKATLSHPSPSEDIDSLYARMVGQLNQFNSVTHFMKQRFPVAPKLTALAETLPARTWIQNLAANRESRTLKVQAIYLIDPAKPYDLPSKGWVEALKKNPHFNQGLKRLELGPSSRTARGEAKLFFFELVAEWQP